MTSTAPALAPLDVEEAPRTLRRRPRSRVPYLLILPAIVILLVGMGYPVVWQLITSFQEYGLAQQFGQDPEFTGIQNYWELATNPAFVGVVLRSVLFCIVTAFVTLGVGLGLAVLMNSVGRTPRLILQVSLLLAWAMPVVAAMTVWIWLFDRRRGVVNYVLDLIPGVDMNRFHWLENPLTFFLVACIIIVWMSVPFVAMSIYAGLTQVSEEVLEAAALDGASPGQRLRMIILPMIRPVVAIVLLLQLIWDLRVFSQITMLQDAGSKAGEFDLLGTFIYKTGLGSQDFGAAGAASVIVLLLTIALSWFYVRSLLKEDAA